MRTRRRRLPGRRRQVRAGSLPDIRAEINYNRNIQNAVLFLETGDGVQQVQLGRENDYGFALTLEQPILDLALGPARSAARLSGYLQLGLGAFVIFEVARRLQAGSSPEPTYMVVASTLALLANVICLKLIAAHREGGVHMRASYIFSQNDVIANAAVIFSGLLVALSGWSWWDLLAGAGIGSLVLWGGVRILNEARVATATGSANIAAQQGDEADVE